MTVATITPTTVNATNVNVSGAIANSTNEVTISSNVKLPSATQIRFYDGANANYTAFRAPASLTANTTFILPDGDGNVDQVLRTDGSGTLSWVDQTGGGGGSQNLFSTIAVAGQTNVVADSTTDTLTFVAGSNMTITTDASTDTITFASSGGGGAGNPGGSDTQVQFNDCLLYTSPSPRD